MFLCYFFIFVSPEIQIPPDFQICGKNTCERDFHPCLCDVPLLVLSPLQLLPYPAQFFPLWLYERERGQVSLSLELADAIPPASLLQIFSSVLDNLQISVPYVLCRVSSAQSFASIRNQPGQPVLRLQYFLSECLSVPDAFSLLPDVLFPESDFLLSLPAFFLLPLPVLRP